MRIGEWKLSWIVCHRATRTVSRSCVQCPLRGTVDGVACLSCRFLTTSSIERDGGPWCEASSAPRTIHRRAPAQPPIPVALPRRVPLPADWPLHLPELVARPAVRPPVALPSGHGIGT